MRVRASLIELYKKVNPFRTQDKVFYNGKDNDYPEKIERAINNSPTGKRAYEMFCKFIFGKGIEDVKLNEKVYLSEVAKDVISDVVYQNGAFIHISYKIETDLEGEVIFMPHIPKSLDYNKCRISEKDDKGNEGTILYKNYNKFDPNLTTKEKNYEKRFYPFNNNQEVIKAQINTDSKKAGCLNDDWNSKIKHYTGQVLYLNLTPKYRYSISKFDSVFNDLDTEYRISLYSNGITKDGFLGKTAILTQGLSEEDSEELKKDIQTWLGAENSSSIYHLDVENVESLDNVLKIIQIDSQFDEKQFESIRKSLRINILGSANNLPTDLAFSQGNMFDSGEKYKELKKFYWEQCEWERQAIEKTFLKLGYNINFKPIYNVDNVTK